MKSFLKAIKNDTERAKEMVEFPHRFLPDFILECRRLVELDREMMLLNHEISDASVSFKNIFKGHRQRTDSMRDRENQVSDEYDNLIREMQRKYSVLPGYENATLFDQLQLSNPYKIWEKFIGRRL